MSNISKIDKKHSSSEEGYGYVSTQANLKPKTEQNSKEESNSTSSNDEENGRRKPHTNLQKPRPKKKIISAAEKRELRRKKLIERSKSKRLKVKALIHHVPTDEDIAGNIYCTYIYLTLISNSIYYQHYKNLTVCILLFTYILQTS